MGKDKDKKKKKSKFKSSSSSKHKHKHSSHHKSSDEEDNYDSSIEKSKHEDDNVAGGEEDEWVEAAPSAAIPQQPQLTQNEPSNSSETKRQEWMSDTLQSIFSTTTATSSRSQQAVEREKEQERKDAIRKERELNPYFSQGGTGLPSSATETANDSTQNSKRKFEFGDAGSSWRMMKLQRIYEIADREGKSVEEVALDRYGSMDLYQEALDERDFLDKRGSGGSSSKSKRHESKHQSSSSSERYLRKSDFKVPKGEKKVTKTAAAGTDEFGRELRVPSDHAGDAPKDNRLKDAVPSIPSAIMSARIPPAAQDNDTSAPLSKDELNKMHAKLLKARMMGEPEDKELAERYEREKKRAEMSSGTQPNNVVVVPTIDSRGRLQDVGSTSQGANKPGMKRKREYRETHDETGQRIKYAGDDEKSVSAMELQERMTHSSTYDSDLASQIARDVTFKGDLEYMDDKAGEFARQAPVNDYKKSQRAILDYKKAEAAQQKCHFCFNDGAPPKCSVVAMGTKSYLGLPLNVEMVPGHCLIVPMQHVLTTLECEDDVWDEIKNFMKCLIQMQWKEGKGIIFMEQVINFRWHKHTVIECIPVPQDKFEDASAYFKEALNACEDEWSQHKKVIDTSAHGFRRSMVKNLPYFHVWFDPKRGYGHVIENSEVWEEWFGREVLASMMEVSPDRWRRPRRANENELARRQHTLKIQFAPFDWTKFA